jgi:hypothetical protein
MLIINKTIKQFDHKYAIAIIVIRKNNPLIYSYDQLLCVKFYNKKPVNINYNYSKLYKKLIKANKISETEKIYYRILLDKEFDILKRIIFNSKKYDNIN